MTTFNSLPEAVDQIKDRLSRIESLLSNQKPVSENKNFTLEEAANYCKLPVPTFRLHLQKRNVLGSKPGKTWIFTKQDLDSFIENHRVKAVEPSDFLINQRKGR